MWYASDHETFLSFSIPFSFPQSGKSQLQLPKPLSNYFWAYESGGKS